MENGLNFENKDDLKSKALYNTQVKIKGMYKLIEFIKTQINETTSAIYTEIQNCDDTIEVIKRHNMVANIKCVFYPSLCNSLLVAIYSILETSLYELCDAYVKTSDINIRWCDMKGNGITQVALYLEKVVGIGDINKYPNASLIDTLRILRNRIVHNNAMAKDDDELKRFQKMLRVCIWPEGLGIFIMFEHLIFYLDSIKEFLEYVYSIDNTTL